MTYEAALRWLHENIIQGPIDPKRASAVEMVADLFEKEVGQVVWDAERVLKKSRTVRSITEARKHKKNPWKGFGSFLKEDK